MGIVLGVQKYRCRKREEMEKKVSLFFKKKKRRLYVPFLEKFGMARQNSGLPSLSRGLDPSQPSAIRREGLDRTAGVRGPCGEKLCSVRVFWLPFSPGKKVEE